MFAVPALHIQHAFLVKSFESLFIAEFCVNMTCKGTKDGTAHMLIQINITSEERQFVLNLQRIKSCRKGILNFANAKLKTNLFQPVI